jgi:hypothetical protein
MPSVQRKLTVIPRAADKRHHAATLKPVGYITPAPLDGPASSRYNLGLYPWDDYQDDIIVNSIEEDHGQYPKPQLAGVEHYRAVISPRKDYKHICVHFDEYRRIGERARDLSNIKDEDADRNIKPEPHLNIDDTHLPTPRDNYGQPIYQASITNPAVFLAIARIAQKNICFLDLTSALDHLPNLPPDHPLPKLVKGKSVYSIPHEAKDSDLHLTIAFLPNYYEDTRHALGFFHLENDTNPQRPTRVWVRTCLFTPCTTADLEEHGLVDWVSGQRGGKIEAVGSRDGAWLCADVVEDWEDWKTCETVVGDVWRKRVRKCRGI